MISLDGKLVSQKRLHQLKQEIHKLKARRPKLVVLRVGNHEASKIYVKKKIEACHFVGIESEEIHLDENSSKDLIINLIEKLNHDSQVDGILIQLPLPDHISANEILGRISPDKDVDGFHVENLGKLIIRDETGFAACTPLGVMNLLSHYQVDLNGKFAVVMGRSRIVGRPMSLLLDAAGATVCVVHSKTENPKRWTEQADILIVAIGQPESIDKSFIKKGAVVVDVGIHKISGKIVGDVKKENLSEWVSALTPVPGGVGPMTICSLLENCLFAFKKRFNLI